MLQRLPIDLDQQKFVADILGSKVLGSINLKRGDNDTLQFQFVHEGVTQELGGGTTFSLGLKDLSALAGNYLVQITSFTKTGSGSSTLYTCSPWWESTALDAFMTGKSEPQTTQLGLELLWTYSGVEKRTQLLAVNLENSLNRDSTPSPPGPTAAAGKTAIPNGQDFVTVTFGTALSTANWHFLGSPTIANTTDGSPVGVYVTGLTARSTTGFTLQLSTAVPTANYQIEWVISAD